MRNHVLRGVSGALAFFIVAGGSAAFAASGTRTSSFAYDAATGLLTQEVVEPNTSAMRLQTDYTYNAFGQKVTVTVSGVDIATRSSTTTYDVKGQFATGNTNALNHSESWQYDARFGSPTSHTGPNNLTTTWTYDAFGRKSVEVRADGTQTKWTYSFCSGVNGGTATCVSGAAYLVQTGSFAADGVTPNAPTAIVYYDRLDRELARETQGFNGSTVRASRQYDALGRVSQTSRPYFVSGGTPQWTTYTYDAAGRVLTATTPDSGVNQTAYHGLTTVETNALNQTRTIVKDSQGQVKSITDALNKTMTHTYDPFGNLLSTTDAVGNVVSATFDTRGRRLTTVDPDMGTWSYTYNVLGQLVSQTDAKIQTSTFIYDKLNRLVQRAEPDMTSVWTYDTATKGIGKLASAGITAGPGAGFQRSVTYDTLGRPNQIATTIDGSTYAMGAIYDANGRISKVSYPSGFTARYGYNSLGYANQLQDDTSLQSFWTVNAMDAEQHLTQTTAGNGLVTTRAFSATNGRLTSINTGASNTVQALAYTYDLLGNPLSRTDANTNLSETFTYDSLNRLVTATVNLSPTPLAKLFSYDSIGNMLSKSDVGTYVYPTPGSARPHAVTSISGGAINTTFSYDANGNQTGGLNRTISYTSYNKPSSITQGARTISFLDDYDHQRFKQVTPEGTTLYIAGFGVMAEITGAGTAAAKWTDYLSIGNAHVGMRVLQVASETLNIRYFHTDHLGSISVITNEAGAVQERLSYDAWGKPRNPNGTDATSISSQTTRGFTGEEQLSVASLVHLNGRVYDPILARMTSADPTVTDPSNPQGWNRYSYVGNDPLAFTDPSGFSWLSQFFHSVARALSSIPILRSIVQIVVTAVLSAIVPFAGTIIGAALAAAGGAAIVTGLSGGSLSQVLRSAAMAAVTAVAFWGVGSATNAIAGVDPSGAHITPQLGTPESAFNVAGHAAVGCGMALASKGSCGAGAMAGAAGSIATSLTGGLFRNADTNLGERLGATAIMATAGGLGSLAGGGKFADGAVTAAFGYLFNQLSRDQIKALFKWPGHHPFTRQMAQAFTDVMTDEAVEYFSRRTIGTDIEWDRTDPNNPNRWRNDTGHPQYNKDALEIGRKYISDNGITQSNPMSVNQAAELDSILRQHQFNAKVEDYVLRSRTGGSSFGRAFRSGGWFRGSD